MLTESKSESEVELRNGDEILNQLYKLLNCLRIHRDGDGVYEDNEEKPLLHISAKAVVTGIGHVSPEKQEAPCESWG